VPLLPVVPSVPTPAVPLISWWLFGLGAFAADIVSACRSSGESTRLRMNKPWRPVVYVRVLACNLSNALRKKLPMTKKELAHAIAEETNMSKTLVMEIIQRVFDEIIGALEREGRIELRNFGNFEVKQRKPRKARNPRTGENVIVPAKLGVRFKPGREMEERVRVLENVPARKK
jgi:nucleoid DNA-binding protein